MASYSIGLRGSQSSVHWTLLGCVALVVGLQVILEGAAQHPGWAVKGLGTLNAVFCTSLGIDPEDGRRCDALDDAAVRFRVTNRLSWWTMAVVEALDALVLLGADWRGGFAEALLLTVHAVAALGIIVNADEESILSDFAA